MISSADENMVGFCRYPLPRILLPPGNRRLETEYPVRPAFGFEPRPTAPSSLISPPAPVAAPGKGAIAVGWL